ncbi:hypothetical protein EDD16DRAFT_1733529 [Pisolithus croceorrhizus]|nr:hypothetical protein EDD16DRAFT_1733529 [Pisolithus croceorrhizus]KAI6159086.1 hypothetical protein EDD17DRAFT_1898977 [Pisolithus thermaeus]
MHYAEDVPTLKSLVAAIWVLDTLHVVFVCHALYYYLITNYGVPTSLEYIVWSLSASDLINVLVIFVVQCFFAHQIYLLCRPQVKRWVTTAMILFIIAELGIGMGKLISAHRFIDRKASVLAQIRFYGVIPAVAIIALAEALITISLCVLLYGRRSGSALPRMKRVLNTLIIYAINRCLLVLLVAIAALVTAVETQDTWFLGLSFVIGKSSLNSREHLRSRDAGTLSCLRTSAVLFTNPPKLLGDVESSKDEARQSDVPGVADISITIDPAPDKTTALRGDGEV